MRPYIRILRNRIVGEEVGHAQGVSATVPLRQVPGVDVDGDYPVIAHVGEGRAERLDHRGLADTPFEVEDGNGKRAAHHRPDAIP